MYNPNVITEGDYMSSELAELKPCYVLEQPVYPKLPQCENASVRPISREVQLAWLAGIIDGEGNIDGSLGVQKPANSGRRYFEPKVRIMNTDLRMIRRIAEIYIAENLVFFYHFSNVCRYKNKKPHWKNAMHISICSKGSVKKVLELVVPYLVNKQEVAKAIIKVIDLAQSMPKRGRNSTSECFMDGSEFADLMARFKAEKDWYVDPSTSIRRAREVITW